MNIAIRATEEQKEELVEKGFGKSVSVQWIGKNEKLAGVNAEALFDFMFTEPAAVNDEFDDSKLVFIHSVNYTCREINKANYIRLNAWKGFLNRPVIELACNHIESQKKAEAILIELGWQYVWVADDYGFVAARIIAMIVNEAYFALEENVSTKQQIDIAMKLGTNYPYGPFEWSEKIGLINISNLLDKLSRRDQRYAVSALLGHECQQF